ncbi:MAG: Fic family protein [Patescibacteria group bacterium]
MIDTIHSVTQARIFEFLFRNAPTRSSDIHEFILQKEGSEVSLVTIKRLLARLRREGSLVVTGKGPATRYSLTNEGKLSALVDAKAYCAQEPDSRFGLARYQFDVFPSLLSDPFTPEELVVLESATEEYTQRSNEVSATLHQKELERFIIELSWKSSKIEGNTYTLLDTERLLLYGEEAQGRSKDEALMILNHKAAFTYIYENRTTFKKLSRTHIEEVHTLLTKDLPIARNLRSSAVGVIGSRYQPLDNRFQIEEALVALLEAIDRMPHGYAKALVALMGLSYLQAFEDGNKRTARLVGNAVLLAYGLSPLSYRSVSEEEYREATLVFYELNSLHSFKKLFIAQYQFAARNYLLS